EGVHGLFGCKALVYNGFLSWHWTLTAIVPPSGRPSGACQAGRDRFTRERLRFLGQVLKSSERAPSHSTMVARPLRDPRPIYASGACEIDLARRELRVLGSRVPVGGRALEIVEVLAQSAGELVTKDELMSRIWPGAIVAENTLQVHVAAVRKALGPY